MSTITKQIGTDAATAVTAQAVLSPRRPSKKRLEAIEDAETMAPKSPAREPRSDASAYEKTDTPLSRSAERNGSDAKQAKKTGPTLSHSHDPRDGQGAGNRSDASDEIVDRASTIAAIITLARRRTAAIRATTALTNQRLAVIRSALGFQTTDAEDSRAKAVAASAAIDKALRDGTTAELDASLRKVANTVALYCSTSRSADAEFRKAIITPCEREIEKLVELLPEWKAIGAIRGVGPILLAEIIGTVGDLSQYKGPRSLRKMLGGAPHNGKALSTWKKFGGLSAAEWESVKASPNRYVLLFRLGDSQIKSRGPYRKYYDERKPVEAARLDDEGKPVTPMVAHRRASRVMVSKLLNDLWAMSKGLTPLYLPAR